MEYGALMPNSSGGVFTENTNMEVDFMDELLFEGCWLETSATGFNFMQPSTVVSSTTTNSRPLLEPNSHYLMPSSLDQHHHYPSNSTTTLLSINPNHQIYQEDHTEGNDISTDGKLLGDQSFLIEGNEIGRRLWIGPRANPGPSSSVKERMILAIGYLKEGTKDRDVLIQIWVPIKRGGTQILTTYDQPYAIDPNSKSLANYRDVSKAYRFLTEEDSAESVGLPSRAFLGKLPEWTPDVRFFKSYEYPRISYAQQYDVRGSLALPIFERGSGTCLGVVEIVMTTQKINYRPELEYVCQALEAVDLRSFHDFSPPTVKTCDELYQAALSEIVEVLTTVCKTHRFPLALTWAPCIQQGKGGWRHSDENYALCVSTVDSACLVADLEILGFHEACSEHHLLRGQGIVGTAFASNKPCFATDVTAFSKTEYPLSHHARMFGLCAAVAIPFRSVYTGSLDFVLELFLPKDCQDSEEQKQMLNSLSIVIQQSCRSLHVVIGKELEEEVMLPIREAVDVADGGLSKEEITHKFECSSEEPSLKESSWISHMMEAQQQGKGISVSLDYPTEEVKEEFRVTTHWDNNHGSVPNTQIFSDFGQIQQSSAARSSVEGGGDSYSFGGRRSSAGRKSGEKRRTKTEKTISLQVLRQYFAGSLKDAAKSIGVCPTTLKRICRQHGITRWPSRKIKKVGHSLRKLQLVIDSVQGAEGAIQIGSFYSSFPELNSQKFQGTGPLSPGNTSDHSRHLNSQHEIGLFNHGNNTKSPSSSSSQTSGSSLSATERQLNLTNMNVFNNGDSLLTEDPVGMMKRACSETEFLASNQDETKLFPKSQSYISLSDNGSFEILPPIPGINSRNLQDGYGFRVKANLGDEKIRFTLQPNSSFRDLQQEIARRFNLLDDISTIEIKYLDDDREWVLLKCNADLQECMEIYKSSQSRTIILFLQRNTYPNQVNSYGSCSPS